MTRWLERVLLVVGIALLGWYSTVKIAASREQAALSRELEAARITADHAQHGAADAEESADSKVPQLRDLVGRLEVPRVKLSAIAREGVDARTLRGSVGHVPGTALPGDEGNAAFAAHRDTYFAALKDVRMGDEVVITTKDGVHRYTVTQTRVVDPSEVSVLDATGGRTLTLVTCYPFDYVGSAPRRFIVHARGI
jgi:sortase A